MKFSKITVLSLFSCCLIPSSLFAETLTAVPMQGGMIMPMISYHSAENRLHAMMDPAIPQLTPLLASNPEDDFAPEDPWHELLSPTRQGLSFSRSYGFIMAANTELLPSGTEIWMRKISSTPGLGIYFYSTSEPKQFEPIFGTDGVTNALHWNGMMFHPAITAPTGTNTHSAIFEAYLVDVTSGTEIPNSSTGSFTLEWTNIADNRPTLRIVPGIRVLWPATAAGYILEAASGTHDAPWTAITDEPVEVDGELSVTLDPDATMQFFRMKLAP